MKDLVLVVVLELMCWISMNSVCREQLVVRNLSITIWSVGDGKSGHEQEGFVPFVGLLGLGRRLVLIVRTMLGKDAKICYLSKTVTPQLSTVFLL